MTTPPPDQVPAFVMEAFQNPYLAAGAERVDAILSVTAAGVAASNAPLLLGFVLDTSGSMHGPRLEAVRGAVQAAIRLLDSHAGFFVVAFAGSARVVVHPTRASDAAKDQAIQAVRFLVADGGTAMSQGLAAARSLFAASAEAIGQCLFLAGAKDDSRTPAEVTLELQRSAGLFTCDCWGVGTSWQVGEVQEIARGLLGKASLIPDPAGIDAAFREAVGRRGDLPQAREPDPRGLHQPGARGQRPGSGVRHGLVGPR